MIQVRLFGVSAETLWDCWAETLWDSPDETLGLFSGNSWMVQQMLINESAETIGCFSRNSLMVQLKLWWFGWNTWMVLLKILDDSAETLETEVFKNLSWTIQEFHLNHTRLSVQQKLLEGLTETLGWFTDSAETPRLGWLSWIPCTVQLKLLGDSAKLVDDSNENLVWFSRNS